MHDGPHAGTGAAGQFGIGPGGRRRGRGDRSAADIGAPILVVSQFTLYANTVKGRRPSWNAAAPASTAEPMVAAFADALRSLGAEVHAGVFGAHMEVASVNDGPVTVLLEL